MFQHSEINNGIERSGRGKTKKRKINFVVKKGLISSGHLARAYVQGLHFGQFVEECPRQRWKVVASEVSVGGRRRIAMSSRRVSLIIRKLTARRFPFRVNPMATSQSPCSDSAAHCRDRSMCCSNVATLKRAKELADHRQEHQPLPQDPNGRSSETAAGRLRNKWSQYKESTLSSQFHSSLESSQSLEPSQFFRCSTHCVVLLHLCGRVGVWVCVCGRQGQFADRAIKGHERLTERIQWSNRRKTPSHWCHCRRLIKLCLQWEPNNRIKVMDGTANWFHWSWFVIHQMDS